MRDNDRSKVYRAEFAVRTLLEDPGTSVTVNGVQFRIPDERKFGRVEDIQTYVDRVLSHVGYEGPPVRVRKRKGQTKAHYEPVTQVIAIPDDNNWAMREIVVLHELAHHLTGWGVESHGKEFRSKFCELAETVLAPEARFMLQMSFWAEGLTA